jgi:hypothetical protein
MFHPKRVELFTGNKNTVLKVPSCWKIFKKLIHDARTDKHKIIFFLLTYVSNGILKSNFWASTECTPKENTHVSFTKIASRASRQSHICAHTV